MVDKILQALQPDTRVLGTIPMGLTPSAPGLRTADPRFSVAVNPRPVVVSPMPLGSEIVEKSTAMTDCLIESFSVISR